MAQRLRSGDVAVLEEVELFVARRSPRNRERSTYVSPSSPASLTIVMLLFFSKRSGWVRTIPYSPCFAHLRLLRWH
jgi:hypothetical protein